MKKLMCALAVLALSAPAFAQSNSAAPRSTTTPPAVADPSDANKTTAAPVAGKNSFTEEQAMKRLKDHGYSDVTGLMKDDKSVWHGKATKGGQAVKVAVDYQGNITAE
jgi:hypothetical protein